MRSTLQNSAGRRQFGPAGSTAKTLSGFLPEQLQSVFALLSPGFLLLLVVCFPLESQQPKPVQSRQRSHRFSSQSVFPSFSLEKAVCWGFFGPFSLYDDSLLSLFKFLFFFFLHFVSCYNLSVTSCHSSWVGQDLMQWKRARQIMPPRNVCREHLLHRGARVCRV